MRLEIGGRGLGEVSHPIFNQPEPTNPCLFVCRQNLLNGVPKKLREQQNLQL